MVWSISLFNEVQKSIWKTWSRENFRKAFCQCGWFFVKIVKHVYARHKKFERSDQSLCSMKVKKAFEKHKKYFVVKILEKAFRQCFWFFVKFVKHVFARHKKFEWSHQSRCSMKFKKVFYKNLKNTYPWKISNSVSSKFLVFFAKNCKTCLRTT